MHLSPEANYAILRPEWVEWESELPFNKCRTATFFNGSLSVYQVSCAMASRVPHLGFQFQRLHVGVVTGHGRLQAAQCAPCSLRSLFRVWLHDVVLCL